MPKKIQWYARGGGIAQAGPFPTQAAAAAAMRLAPEARARSGQLFPDDVFVWPEEVRGGKR